MGILSSIPFLSAGSTVLGVTVSMLAVAVMLSLWVLMLLVLHPVHATIFLLACAAEYLLIDYFGFDLWIDFFAFFGFYIAMFAAYTLGLRRFLPLPKSEIEQLIKLAQLKQDNLLSEEEFKAAKKRLLKL